jgi:hypothetical protein
MFTSVDNVDVAGSRTVYGLCIFHLMVELIIFDVV